ncbi:ImmA/IrrE family metallo-endopeptidase [Fructilactobacillus sanfranciscensis]|uniref:ImmA/IrrE family metallo-endopeptidase n=1 Tax=Fructilactobacillus sanfranciscensis TaxID=1625 RepID=UPI0031FA3CD3
MRLPFVIAHEIAHALVCDKDDVALYSRTFLHDKYEYRDNCLAAKLLLPYYLEKIEEHEQINIIEFMDMFYFTDDMYDACQKIIRDSIKS